MSTNYKGTNKRFTWTNNTSDAVASGDAVVFGAALGVAVVDIAAGASGELDAKEVFTLPAASADSWDMGAQLYWDASAGNLTDTVGANTLAGMAAADKAALETTASVDLNVNVA